MAGCGADVLAQSTAELRRRPHTGDGLSCEHGDRPSSVLRDSFEEFWIHAVTHSALYFACRTPGLEPVSRNWAQHATASKQVKGFGKPWNMLRCSNDCRRPAVRRKEGPMNPNSHRKG